MIYHITAVFDVAVGAYTKPIFTRSKSEAVRAFTDEVNNNQSAISAHPEDYRLFYLGVYNDTTATFQPINTPEHIIDGKEVKHLTKETNHVSE